MELDNDFFLLVCDFKLALNPFIDTKNYNTIINPKAREKLLVIIDDLNLLEFYMLTKRYIHCVKTLKTRAFILYFDI